MYPFAFDDRVMRQLARERAEELAADWRAANPIRGCEETTGLVRLACRALGRALVGLGVAIARRRVMHRTPARRTGLGC